MPPADSRINGTNQAGRSFLHITIMNKMEEVAEALYVRDLEQIYHPYVSPLLAEDLSRLPPALVLVAEHDELRADGERFAERLRAAGVSTEVYCQMGVGHLAGDGARASSVATESLDVAVTALKKGLGR